jgi:autotransporter adhesin
MNAAAMGAGAMATGSGSAAFGAGAMATANNSVAIGAGSMASFMNTVSVGSVGNYRRIVNVADPTAAHDAVTLGYLQNNYSTTGTTSDAIANLSHEIDSLNQQMAALNGSSGSTSTSSSPSVASASAATSTATPAAASDSPVPGTHSAGASAATAGTSQQHTAVADANNYTDQQTQEALRSANTYADAATSQTLSSANAYTNAALANYVTTDAFNQFQNQVNMRFQEQDKRIDTLGAMSAAATQMAINTAGLTGDNRVGVGLGTYGGRQAASLGYQHMFSNQKASISAGVSSGNGETSGGVGFGFSW